VRQRRRVQDRVARHDGLDVGEERERHRVEVRVGERHALRPAGRAAGVEEPRRVVARHLRERQCRARIDAPRPPRSVEAHDLAQRARGRAAERGQPLAVDERQRTGVDGIYAVGDITGPPMLAHRGSYQGIVAAENAAGEDVVFDARAVPSVAYTDPEIAWAGLTESEAKVGGIEYEIGKVPWAASGRALAIERSEGMTKVLAEPETGRILGAGMVGPNAGELIAEVMHAIEMGSTVEDISLTMHPHPTLSETVRIAAEAAQGIATDIYAPKR